MGVKSRVHVLWGSDLGKRRDGGKKVHVGPFGRSVLRREVPKVPNSRQRAM